jgi:hypothetical protein
MCTQRPFIRAERTSSICVMVCDEVATFAHDSLAGFTAVRDCTSGTLTNSLFTSDRLSKFGYAVSEPKNF